MNWVGSKSRNRAMLEKTDDDVKLAMSRLDKSIDLIKKQVSARPKEIDEEGYYCLNLAERLRKPIHKRGH